MYSILEREYTSYMLRRPRIIIFICHCRVSAEGSCRGCLVGVLLCMCESVASVLYVYSRTIVSLH
jgi:hypothetical protein